MKSRFSRTTLILIGVFALFFASTAQAQNIRITQTGNYWFTFSAPTTFQVRTYAVDGYWSDPMLWLYNSDGVLLAQNDDWFGLQSNIQINLDPGEYRLRTGVCCWDPNRWYDGVQYDLWSDQIPYQTTTTSEQTTTTTEPPETSTTSTTSTTVPEPQSSTLPTWETTTTTSEPTPTTVTSTTSSPTSSSTTTTQPDPPTTTSTLMPTTTTERSTTTTVTVLSPPEPSTTSSPVSSVPSQITVRSTISPTTTTYRTTSTVPTSVSSIGMETTTTTTTTLVSESLNVTTVTDSNPDSSSSSSSQRKNPTKTYRKKVGIGPISFTIEVTEQQRTTVIAAAIVQITTVASISAVSTGGTGTRSRK